MPRKDTTPKHRAAAANTVRSAADIAAYDAKRKAFASIMHAGDENGSCDLVTLAIDLAVIAARETPPFYLTDELAQRYAVSRRTIEMWPIKRHKFGNSVRYSRGSVEQFELESREIPD